MQDEQTYLAAKFKAYEANNPLLAHQILRHAERRGRAFEMHRDRLQKLQKFPGFIPTALTPGQAVQTVEERCQGSIVVGQDPELPTPVSGAHGQVDLGTESEEEEEKEESDDELLSSTLEAVLALTD
ncbi:hypothetical protein E1B28_010550 [Marasmius oreades]|uniref:Uncharacterized protein n=1 Tax=Marasmius oreades TaxID=181124 RepID=A0A9P7RYJ2_9AGAR|nr:uncharacterized protein E1B28_010550 [Marasmius oreades]KAG7091521.1 hypothetical protein E1B28_010550 [Marasmius oreades]